MGKNGAKTEATWEREKCCPAHTICMVASRQKGAKIPYRDHGQKWDIALDFHYAKKKKKRAKHGKSVRLTQISGVVCGHEKGFQDFAWQSVEFLLRALISSIKESSSYAMIEPKIE